MGVAVRVAVGSGIGLGVTVGVGVGVGVGAGVRVGEGVTVGFGVGVSVGETVGAAIGSDVGEGAVGVAVGATRASMGVGWGVVAAAGFGVSVRVGTAFESGVGVSEGDSGAAVVGVRSTASGTAAGASHVAAMRETESRSASPTTARRISTACCFGRHSAPSRHGRGDFRHVVPDQRGQCPRTGPPAARVPRARVGDNAPPLPSTGAVAQCATDQPQRTRACKEVHQVGSRLCDHDRRGRGHGGWADRARGELSSHLGDRIHSGALVGSRIAERGSMLRPTGTHAACHAAGTAPSAHQDLYGSSCGGTSGLCGI